MRAVGRRNDPACGRRTPFLSTASHGCRRHGWKWLARPATATRRSLSEGPASAPAPRGAPRCGTRARGVSGTPPATPRGNGCANISPLWPRPFLRPASHRRVPPRPSATTSRHGPSPGDSNTVSRSWFSSPLPDMGKAMSRGFRVGKVHFAKRVPPPRDSRGTCFRRTSFAFGYGRWYVASQIRRGSHRQRNVGKESGNRLAFQTLTIGRRRGADIRLTDMSVSRMHAEVTIAGDGRCFLIDCGSSRGTWTKSGNGEWTRHRQGYVEALVAGAIRPLRNTN